MKTIPVAAVSSQIVTATLSSQPCRINLYQKSTGLYLDLYVNDVLKIGGVVCLNGVRIVRDAYLGFIGDLGFYDTQGKTDPVSSGLGSRYVLVYLEAADL